jgi:proteasome lid subunit RPN8/RPN11
MSKIDVSDLQREDLPAGKFPVDPRAPFRLQIAPEVHRGIQAHAQADPSIEICGILVGRWGRDEQGPFAQVTDYIRCDSASSKLAEVTFTHESWAHINHEMDTKYADKRIVGWYHTHPDFGIFLSDRDCFIHEHFFSGPGQVAYVVDPVRDLEGVFSWQKGRPTTMTHYWVGNELRTHQSSERASSRRAEPVLTAEAASPPAAGASGPATRERASWLSTATLLAGMGLFLLGYMLAGARTRWEQQNIIQGAVAHYGFNKVMKLGLEQELAKVRSTLRAIEGGLGKLPKATDKLSEEEAEKAEKQRRVLNDSLLLAEQSLERIQSKYTLSPEELAMYAQIVAIKQAELNQLLDGAARSPAPAGKAAPKAPASGEAPSKSADSSAKDRPAQSSAPTSPESKPEENQPEAT